MRDEDLTLRFDFLFHNPNPWIDDYLHGDHTHTDDEGEEVTSPGTPDRPVVIEPEPEPVNPNPGRDPDADPAPTTRSGDSRIAPLTKADLDALTNRPSVTTGGRHDGGSADEFIFDGVENPGTATPTYGTGDGGERLYGGGGNDVLVGGHGDDYLNGGPGDDYLFAGKLEVLNDGSTYGDRHGDGASNILDGGPGNDYLENGGDFDLLDGGPGNDHLVAFGDDSYHVAMIGGAGRDVFDVSASDVDTVKILDFRNGEDKILLGNNHFAEGQLDLSNLAAAVPGVQFDMAWIADEVDNGVTFPLHHSAELTIQGARLSELQFEVVGDDIFIV